MNLETQADFARRIGRNKSHITRLKQAGRLVMREGKVAVDESLRLISDTESPLPRDAANRERLAAERETDVEVDQDIAAIGRRHKAAQAEKMMHEAAILRLERQRLEGSLVPVDDVVKVASDIASTTRNALENLSDRYAPELVAATTIDQAQAILDEAVELVLAELSRAIDHLAEAFKP